MGGAAGLCPIAARDSEEDKVRKGLNPTHKSEFPDMSVPKHTGGESTMDPSYRVVVCFDEAHQVLR
jgi:hypothetical protein